MALKLITAPTEEPLTLTEAKLQCRVDGSDEDTLLTSLITVARQMVEQRTGRAVLTQTWELALDDFPRGAIDLLMAPVQSITSVKYIDQDGVEQTVSSSNYALDSYGVQHQVVPGYGFRWPAARDITHAVKVRFVAGYASKADVPASLKQWMLLAIATMYKNREAVITGTIVAELPRGYLDALLDDYRVTRL
jgi:uncharacterized phiE125 gp8 family phage protein